MPIRMTGKSTFTGKAVLEQPRTDPFFSDVQLLMHFDGFPGNTATTDNSNNDYPSTFNGAAQISNTQALYGPTSLDVSGNNNITIASASDWTSLHDGTIDWTLEIALYPISTGNGRMALDNDGSSTAGRGIAINVLNNGALQVFVSRGTGGTYALNETSAPGVVVDDQWNQVALVHEAGSGITAYVDGVEVIAQTALLAPSASAPTFDLGLGRIATAPAVDPWDGFIDELRITYNQARYTGAYTPPTLPFPDS